MKKFRLPRKIKKKLKYKFFLYPPDEEGNSLMAFPTGNQTDYDAYKRGELRDILENVRRRNKNIPYNSFTYNGNEYKYIDYGINGKDIFILSFNDNKEKINIQCDGLLCKQESIRGEILFKFKSDSQYFDREWWYKDGRVTNGVLDEMERVLNEEFMAIPEITIDRGNFIEAFAPIYIENVKYLLTWNNCD